MFKRFLKIKIIVFVFRYKFRNLALNNLLKSKKIGKYFILDLSGFGFSWFGFLLYKLNFLESIKFISCDGWPFLSDQKNSINIWFGGTKLKIPKKYEKFSNNYVTASTLFTHTEKLVEFYPCKIKKRKQLSDPKIIIALSCKDTNDQFILNIWNKHKDKILEDLSLLEHKDFWKKLELDSLEVKKKHYIYVCIKTLVRIELLKIVKNKFKDKCILIGDDLKKYFPDAYKTKFSYGYLKKFYNGNICLDFLAKDGKQALYPRSIEILENGGILTQIKTISSSQLFQGYKNDLVFNSDKEMLEILSKLLKNKNLNEINEFFQSKFNNDSYNENTLKKVLK